MIYLMEVNDSIRKYLAEIGSKGGRLSKRALNKEDARDMVRIREARRAFRRYHSQCFWSFDPNYRIAREDLPWVVEQLIKHGNRKTWEAAQRLCR